MDIKQLEYFVVACERGSLSQAALCMYTSQPNVSKTIRSLEQELGRALLQRSGKGVSPTVYGETVLEYAKMILKSTAVISSLAAVQDCRNSIRISSYPSNMIARLLVDFYKEMGNEYSIEHHEGTVEEITEQVHQGISEIGIVYVAQSQVKTFQHILSHKNLEFILLESKRLCLYVGPNHPLYGEDSVDFSTLHELRFVRGVRDFFSMEHHLEHVSMGTIDTNNLNHAVYSNSDHLTINLLLYTDVCSLELEPYEYSMDIASQILDEAGWTMGSSGIREKDGKKLELNLLYNSDSVTEKTIAEYLQSEYLKLGVSINIHGEEEQSYRDNMKAGNFDMVFNICWGMPYDPQSSLAAMRAPVYGDYSAQQGLEDKAEIDQAITDILTSTDETERQELYTYVLTRLHED